MMKWSMWMEDVGLSKKLVSNTSFNYYGHENIKMNPAIDAQKV